MGVFTAQMQSKESGEGEGGVKKRHAQKRGGEGASV